MANSATVLFGAIAGKSATRRALKCLVGKSIDSVKFVGKHLDSTAPAATQSMAP